MGRGIVLKRKVHAGFEVRTQGTFPQGTGGGGAGCCVIFGFSYVSVQFGQPYIR